MCSPDFEERKDMNNPNNLVQDQQRNDLVVDDIQEDIGSMVATAAESSKEAKVRIYLNPTSLGHSKQNNGSMGYEKHDFNGVYTKPTSEEYSRQNNGSMALSVTAEFWSVSVSTSQRHPCNSPHGRLHAKN